MSKLVISKLSPIGPDAAWNYLLDPRNSLGKTKRRNKFPLTVFGPINKETSLLFKSLAVKRKPTLWNALVSAAEKERQKEFPPVVLYRLEEPEDGEWVEENPLTEEQFQASIQP